MVTERQPWRSVFPLFLVALTSTAFYVRNWKILNQLDLVPRQPTVVDVIQQQQEVAVSDENDSSMVTWSNDSNTTSLSHSNSNLKKDTTTIETALPPPPPFVHGGAFIHVGKTGGSTLTRYLRNACHSFVPKPCGVIPNETQVSKLISDYYHVPDFFRLPRKVHSFYLISVRDPLERTISAFLFGHPNNALVLEKTGLDTSARTMWKRKRAGYFDGTCFTSLEEFASNIGDRPHSYDYPYKAIHLVQNNCTNVCRAMMHSGVKRMTHLFYNYQKIYSLLPPPMNSNNNTIQGEGMANNNNNKITTIYVTRQQHLLEDFVHINRLLGDTSPTSIVFQRDNTHVRDTSNITLPVNSRELSQQGRQYLCGALEEEYKIYLELLLQARNINDDEFQNELAYSRRNCPTLHVLQSERYWNERLVLQQQQLSKT